MSYDPANPTLLIVKNVAHSRDYYRDVFGAQVIDKDDPATLRLANTWLLINRGGGPTDDKPTVTAAPPADPDRLSIALNFRVADIHECYKLWKSRGAHFLTEPKVHKDDGEIRCYIRDPDGYLIEVGQTNAQGT